jgi:microcystin-dependent protein
LPVCFGQGPGLSNYTIGESTGTENVTISTGQLPMHNHMMVASNTTANQAQPGGNMPGGAQAPFTGLWVTPAAAVPPAIQMDPASLIPVGGNQPHENRMPALAITMIIALIGIFPSRN